MKPVHISLILTLFWSAIAGAQTLGYSEAKARADETEGRLGAADMQRLVEAQGKFAGAAFARCISAAGAPPANFTVVLELNADGRVSRSWLRGESRFAQCFRDRMAADFAFRPTSVPFFTSFEYSSAP